MSEAAYYQHHLAEDIGEPGQPEGAGARRGWRRQVLPHAQVGCWPILSAGCKPVLLFVFRQNEIVPHLTRSKNHKICFRFTDEKFSADLLPTVGIDFRVKVFKFLFINLI